MYDFKTFAQMNLDLIFQGFDRMPQPGEEVFAKRFQLQERLTAQVADFLEKELSPQGVAVIIEAEHLCMTMRGVRAAGSRTQTSALRGRMKADPRARAEVLDLLIRGR